MFCTIVQVSLQLDYWEEQGRSARGRQRSLMTDGATGLNGTDGPNPEQQQARRSRRDKVRNGTKVQVA